MAVDALGDAVIALLWKETQALGPHWIAAATIVGLSAVLQMLGTDLTLDPLSTRVAGGESAMFIVFLLSFTIGHSLPAPELIEGPIEFLDSLPLSRIQVYTAKVVAGMLPGLLMVVGSLAVDLGLALVSPVPPDAQIVPTLLYAHGVLFSGAVAGLGLGLLLSWVRGLAWGVLMLGMMMALVGAVLMPTLEPYVPLASWGRLDFLNGQPGHPLGPLVFWIGVGCLGALVSGALFLGPGERFTRQGSWATGSARIAVFGCMGTLVLSCSGFSALGLLIQAPDLFQSVEMTTTENFRVLFRESDREHVTATIDELDTLSAEVGGWVGNDRPVRLDIEFLGAPDNHGGLFTGGKIRLREDADRATLAHELAHAHSFAVSGPSAWHQSSHVRFFEEGLASWTADRMNDAPEIPTLAAAIHAADPVEFDLLVEDERFQNERDMAQAYPLGVAWVEALDDLGGVSLRQCILKGIGEAGARRTAGLALWDQLARRCDFELDTAIERFEQRLETRRSALPSLPELEARVEGDHLVVTATAAPTEWDLVCRFRDTPQTEVSQYVHEDVRDGQCALPLWRLSGLTFDYQVGFVLDRDVVFDRWTTAPNP